MIGKLSKISQYIGYYGKDIRSVALYWRHYRRSPFNLKAYDSGFADRLSAKSTRSVTERLLRAYQKAKQDQTTAPGVYQLGGEWHHILHVEYANFMKALEAGNIEKLDDLLKNFCRNECSLGLAMSSRFLQQRYRLFTKFCFIVDFNRLIERWNLCSLEPFNATSFSFPNVGNPIGMRVDGHLVPMSSLANRYYAKKLLQLKRDPEFTVAEIGGGYGGLAYYLFKECPAGLKYLNFDLPEILRVMSYFILNALPDKKVLLYGESDAQLDQDLKLYDIALLPNYALPSLSEGSVDAFFNSCSMVELDEETVREYFSIIARASRHYFLHVNPDDENVYDKRNNKKHVRLADLSLPENAFDTVYSKKQALAMNLYEYLYKRKESAEAVLNAQ